MGWKGTLRSINAATKAAAREAEKRQREQFKAMVAAEAADSVRAWNEYLKGITSLHLRIADKVDWGRIQGTPGVTKPVKSTARFDEAKNNLLAYRPGLIAKIFGGEKKARLKLSAAVEMAEKEDKLEYSRAQADYNSLLSKWRTDSELSERILSAEPKAYLEALQKNSHFSEEDRIGSKVSVSVADAGVVHVLPYVHDMDIIPNFRRKQLASGKLSETKMPKSEFNELYRDYVSSVALRVSGDVFQILPVDEVYVTCLAELLDTSTGHKTPTPILSVRFVRETYFSLKRGALDPSDSLSNFVHEEKFSRTKGFSRITPLIEI